MLPKIDTDLIKDIPLAGIDKICKMENKINKVPSFSQRYIKRLDKRFRINNPQCINDLSLSMFNGIMPLTIYVQLCNLADHFIEAQFKGTLNHLNSELKQYHDHAMHILKGAVKLSPSFKGVQAPYFYNQVNNVFKPNTKYYLFKIFSLSEFVINFKRIFSFRPYLASAHYMPFSVLTDRAAALFYYSSKIDLYIYKLLNGSNPKYGSWNEVSTMLRSLQKLSPYGFNRYKSSTARILKNALHYRKIHNLH